MSFKPRALIDEHLVRKDENGYSLDHCLVSDTKRSLIQELKDMAELNARIMRSKYLNTNHMNANSQTNIQSLMSYNINKKDSIRNKDNTNTKKVRRTLIDYKDLDYFQD